MEFFFTIPLFNEWYLKKDTRVIKEKINLKIKNDVCNAII